LAGYGGTEEARRDGEQAWGWMGRHGGDGDGQRPGVLCFCFLGGPHQIGWRWLRRSGSARRLPLQPAYSSIIDEALKGRA
jgi:hypothetical protein